MRVIEESKNLFMIMLEFPNLCLDINNKDLSAKNYDALNKRLTILKIKEKFLIMKLHIVKNISNDLYKDVARKIEKTRAEENRIDKDIDIIESSLAILKLKNRIKDNDLGYTEEFISNILDKKINEYNNRFQEYFYNEKTGQTSLVYNGKYMILPYEPSCVAKINNIKSENTGFTKIVRKW